MSAAHPPALEHRRVLVVFSGLLLVLLLAALDSTIVATALPTIVGELGGLGHLAWVVTAYLLAQTIATPLYGKLGDLYGRKIVLQSGIVLFLLGSALCGVSRSMGQLILFRFIQGLGGGGLTVTTQAVVGDLVSPRERGRYQGIFGAVFGVASIAGPLLGGYITTHLSWRWIFYVNLPVGVAALAVLAATLPARAERVAHAIDYAGAALLAAALGAVILVSDLGGTAYPWGSPTVLALVVVAVVAIGGFVLAERRAGEPVLPLGLFRDRTFALTSAIGLAVGFALFGSVTYLPLFLQVVKGASPTGSGLQMVPMMGGMLVTSIVSGQLISRTGRYKAYPVVGTAVMALGLFLLSRMSPTTRLAAVLGTMLVLGLGLGMVMQVLVVAVQNAVPYRFLGVATSGATLFRLIGGALGTAVLGAIFAVRLARNLAALLPPARAAEAAGAGLTPGALAALPPALRALYAQAFTAALGDVFLVATGVGLVAFVLTWLVPERPLRETVAAVAGEVGREAGETFPMPAPDASLPILLEGVAALADRDVQRRYIEAIVRRAGVDLDAAAAWLLVRLEHDPALDPHELGRSKGVPPERIDAALGQLYGRGLLVDRRLDGRVVREPSDAGSAVLARLVAARREHLTALAAEWGADRRAELPDVLRELARELVPEARRRG
ncbi:MAG: DHA2 family efflux MFS transporter permease subunit [Gemmatimonadetes bacterium]|nr:DHA2 family efflux MFS transporter permease subunit [Gemmatimonadota bacterium]